MAKREFTPIETILNDPTKRLILQSYVDEGVQFLTRLAEIKAQQKELAESAVESLDIDPALLKFWIKMSFNQDFVEQGEKIDRLQSLIVEILGVEQNP